MADVPTLVLMVISLWLPDGSTKLWDFKTLVTLEDCIRSKADISGHQPVDGRVITVVCDLPAEARVELQ